ncbi:uncharacterized protein LOC133891250 [Phragmites australis]|uniref:uncharacterized protein LOC133891250 n=1 Tax=Phragmites australis TaxID=29695 RepID=UPI002D7A2906|nr:uncharacterized protein LOC133891250 [Phragmites australis]
MGLGLPDGNGHGHPRQQMAEAQNSAVAAEFVREQDMMMMMQQATAAQEYHNPATVQHTGMRHGHPHAHQEMLQQMAEAQKLVTATEIARKQDMMMGQATATQKYHRPAKQYNGMGHEQPHQQIVLQMAEVEQLATMAEVGMEQGTMMRQAAATQQYQHPAAQYAAMRLDVTLGHEQPHARQQTMLQMAQAQQMATAAEVAREQDMMVQAQQLPAAAEVAWEQDVMMRQAAAAQQYHHPAAQYAAMGLDVTLGQQTVLQMAQAQQLAAAAEVATEQDMMQRAAAAQQHHNPAVQYAAMGLDVTLGHARQ